MAIQIKRGLAADLPSTALSGELLYTTDTHKVYVGTGASKVQVGDPAVANLSGTNSGDQTITLTSDVTGSGTGSFATTITADAVTNAKMANMATATFKGRTTVGTGDPEDLSVSQAKALLNLTGTNSGDQTITLTGDMTGSGTGSFATTAAATQANINNLSNSSGVAVHGSNTNDSAAAGYIGEIMYQSTSRGSPVSVSNGGTSNVLGTALTLTAGDWDLSGFVSFKGTSSAVEQVMGHATTQSATLGGTAPTNSVGVSDGREGCVASLSGTGLNSSSGNDITLSLAPLRVTLSTSQTIYLIAFAVFTGGTIGAYGRLQARRVR